MADGAFAEEIKEAGRRRKLKDTRVPAELLVQDGTKARIRYDDRAASDADGNATLRRRLPRSWMDLASGAGRTGCDTVQLFRSPCAFRSLHGKDRAKDSRQFCQLLRLSVL